MRLITQLIVSWSCPWQALIQLSSVWATTNTTLIPIWAAEGLIRSDRHPPKDDMWKSSNDLYDSEESDKMCSSPVFYTIKSLLKLFNILRSVYCVNFSPLCVFSLLSPVWLRSMLQRSWDTTTSSTSWSTTGLHPTPAMWWVQEVRLCFILSHAFLLSCSFCSH